MSAQPDTVPADCYRCTSDEMAATGPTDGLCWGCRGEVKANREDARDELVATVYTGHGLGHHYRADVAL